MDAGMKPGFPWQVKGVRPEARETAHEAARRLGMSVGEWLDSLIIDSAGEIGIEPPPRPREDVSNGKRDRRPWPFDNNQRRPKIPDVDPRQGVLTDQKFVEVNERLETLARQLELRDRHNVAVEIAAVNGRIEMLARQIDQRECKVATEDLAAVKTRLDTLAKDLTTVQHPPAEADLAAVKTRFDALASKLEQRQAEAAEACIAEVKDRIDALVQQLERPRRVPDEDLAAVTDRLDLLTSKLEQKKTPAVEEDLVAVKERLDALANQFEQRQSRAIDDGLASVRDRIDALMGKLDQRGSRIADENLGAVHERLDTLAQAVGQIARGNAPSTAQLPTAEAQAERQRLVAEAELAAIKERLDTLAGQFDQKIERPQNRLPADALVAVNERLDTLVQAIDQLARTNNAERTLPQQPADETSLALAEAIARLDQRLDQLITEGRSATSEIEDRVSAVDRAVAELNRGGLRPVLADPATPLDQALFEIAERQRALDGAAGGGRIELTRGPSQELSELKDQLRHISTQIDTMRPCGLDTAVETLRDDLAEIGLMLKEAMPRKAIEALEVQVRSLAERIGDSRSAGVAGVDIANLERGLAEVRDALHSLTPAESLVGFEEAVKELSRKIDALGASQQDPATLDQLEAAIGALRGIVSHVASNDALAKLSDDVRILAEKFDQSGHHDAFANLEQRIVRMAQTLEGRQQDAHDAHALADVVEGLADKLERLNLARGDQAAVGLLEDRIAKLVEKLDASDARLVNLETIERGLAELLIHLEHQRLPALARTGTGGDEPLAVDTLKRDVQRTQDSIEAVHGTLSLMVDRLAMIESGLRHQSQPKPATAATPGVAEAAQSIVPPRPAVPPRPVPAAAAAPKPQEPQTSAPGTALVTTVAGASMPPTPGNPAPASDRGRRPIDPNLPPDHPLEPGFSSGRGRTGNSPADRIAASEAALGAAKPAVVPDPGEKPNFIAAARRAAKAAMAEKPARGDKPAAATMSATAAPTAAAQGTLASRLGKRVRSLLVATSVVLIVLGSVHFAVNLLGSSEDPGQAPATPETPAPRSEAPAEPSPEIAPPGRQSAILPASNLPGFAGMPNTEFNVLPPPSRPAPIQTPARPITPAPAADSAITGSVRQTEAPSTDLAQLAAARPAAGADKLPIAIGNAALRTAAAKGDSSAEFEIAVRFAEGRGVPQDLSTAADWFERAGKQGLIPAQFRLGGLYEKGLGVKKDLERARRLYTVAAEAGNAKAMHNLAVLYAEGIDGKPDFQSAAKWFRKAADHGVADSQYNLAILYARGIGIELSLTEAFKWFTLAAREGDKDAAKKRDELGTRLDQQSVMAARATAQVWTAAPQPEAAVQVKTPAGGWDAAAAAAAAPAPAPGVRRVGPKTEAKSDALPRAVQ
jgi:localization factor PodJL